MLFWESLEHQTEAMTCVEALQYASDWEWGAPKSETDSMNLVSALKNTF
jgi:hypothetical protein